jgi:AraC-like DNA-binding protein
LVKIAVELEQAVARRTAIGAPAEATTRLLASGDGWRVADITCTSGPRDASFEELHSRAAVAIVAAGSFQYRSPSGRALMTPGSLLLGNPGQPFECSHDHGQGDRCLSFQFTADYFDRLASDAGTRGSERRFRQPRLPPLRAMSSLVAHALAALTGSSAAATSALAWEELSVQMAARALELANGTPSSADLPRGAAASVTRVIRAIERHPDTPFTLGGLAREAGWSPWHFLRTFQGVAGLTPHQYLLRTRLREAATRLELERGKIIDIALDSGFNDVSNFTRTFRAEFGSSPREYRRRAQGR